LCEAYSKSLQLQRRVERESNHQPIVAPLE
jgi:hypothetical protein